MCVVSVRPGHKAIKEPQDFGGNFVKQTQKQFNPKSKYVVSAEKTLYQKEYRINIICYTGRGRNRSNHRDNIFFYHVKKNSCLVLALSPALVITTVLPTELREPGVIPLKATCSTLI